MKVVLSIKPEFAEKIFQGSKTFEFRRSIFKREDITTVVVYASAPISKVIGEFLIKKIHKDTLNGLWKLAKEGGGIPEHYFNSYFQQKTEGYAIEITSAIRYDEPLDLANEYGITPPQSFAYVS